MADTKTLERVISKAGLGSRTEARTWIHAKRVTVNGKVTENPEQWIDFDKDHVELDGKKVEPLGRIYVLLYKPTGYITTYKDPEGRKTVYDLLEGVPSFCGTVGRLDEDTSGLLLLTNDSQVAERMTNPEFHVRKTYLVKCATKLGEEAVEKLREGIELSDGMTKPAEVKLVRENETKTFLELTITEGRNRQVRRMVEAVGSQVLKLVRMRLGPLTLAGLTSGKWRNLTENEVAQVKALVGLGRVEGAGERVVKRRTAGQGSEEMNAARPVRSTGPRRVVGSGRFADSRKATGPRDADRPSTDSREAIRPGGAVGMRGSGWSARSTGRRDVDGRGAGTDSGLRGATGPRDAGGTRKFADSRKATRPGGAMGTRGVGWSPKSAGPRRDDEPRDFTDSRKAAGPRGGSGPRKEAWGSTLAGPRNADGGGNFAGPRKAAGPRGGGWSAKSAGPRRDDEPREFTDSRNAGGRRGAAGPRDADGPRKFTDSRKAAGPRGGSGPRKEAWGSTSTGPRKAGGRGKFAGPRKAAGPRGATGPRKSTRPGKRPGGR